MSLSSRQLRAVHRVAEDRLTDQKIATLAGVSRRTLTNWKRLPEFAIRVDVLREQAADSLDQSSLQERRIRVARQVVLDDRQPVTLSRRAKTPEERVHDYLVANGELLPDA